VEYDREDLKADLHTAWQLVRMIRQAAGL
jgi:hypothetical protein